MLADITMGQSPPSCSYNTNRQGVPLIQGNADIFNRVSLPQIWTASPTQQVCNGDILLTVRAPVGHTALSIHDACIGRGVAAIRVKKGVLQSFVYQALIQFEPRWRRLAQGSTFTAISGDDIRNIELRIPRLLEQEYIVEILETWDNYLEKLDKKIEIKKNIKKGLMQQIFSQKIRFKDDHGDDYPEWQIMTLGQIFTSTKGKDLSKVDIDPDGAEECILYGELYTTYPEQISGVISRTDSSKGLLSQKNDLLIPTSTTTTGIDLANVTSLPKAGVLLGGDIIVLRSGRGIDSLFYAYYLTNFKKLKIAKYAQGFTIVHIYFSHIKNIVIDVPSLGEQQKIAHCLFALDKQISQLEDKRTIIDNQRKYLLNNLVTGKIRVPEKLIENRGVTQNA